MRQTISLRDPRHTPARALDAVKSKLRKYLKRERRKKLPDGADFWDFDCKLGLTADTAVVIHVAELNKRLDGFAADGAEAVYVELLAKPRVRQKRPAAAEGSRPPAEEQK